MARKIGGGAERTLNARFFRRSQEIERTRETGVRGSSLSNASQAVRSSTWFETHISAGALTIEGCVLKVTSGQYVKNARVTAEGANLESITNEFGAHRLRDVPADTATIRVANGSLPTVTQSVTVTTGIKTIQNFSVGGSTQ